MGATIVIDHEDYGVRTEFASLAAAQRELRRCGPDFARVTLTERGERVYNEDGACVGRIKATRQTHRHRPQTQEDRGWTGCVTPGRSCDAAHGNIVVVARCRCGAIRQTEINQRFVSRGPWQEGK